MVSDLTGPPGGAVWGLWVWCPAQLTLLSGCAGPWPRGRQAGTGRPCGAPRPICTFWPLSQHWPPILPVPLP